VTHDTLLAEFDGYSLESTSAGQMDMPHNYNYFLMALVGTIGLISGCSDGSDPLGTGRLSLGISDGPVHDATKVCVAFDEVEFKSNSQTTVVTLDPPKTINLLAFQGANAAPLLISQELPAGSYQWMRLGVDAVRGTSGGADDTGGVDCDGDESYIVMSTGTYNLYVPSGENNGLKLVSGFTVPVNGTASFTAEFDLMKSVTAPDGLSPDVLLRPTIRLVDNVEVGTLTGTVSNGLAAPGDCEPSVFVFNEGVTPNAIEEMVDDPNDPVATAIVNFGEAAYEYTVGYLLAGNYNVAFTCDGEIFSPTQGTAASIVAGAITETNFL